MIWLPGTELQQNKIFIEFELWEDNLQQNGPRMLTLNVLGPS